MVFCRMIPKLLGYAISLLILCLVGRAWFLLQASAYGSEESNTSNGEMIAVPKLILEADNKCDKNQSGNKTLSSLEKELEEARKEIARLKDIVKRILEANRREKADMHYNIGCVFRSGGLYTKAEQEFLKALELAPDDPDVHYNLGILYEENLKNKAKAKYHYERYIELAPNEKDSAKVKQWLIEMEM